MDGALCLLDVPEAMRCVLLRLMEVVEMPEDVMRCVLLGMLAVLEFRSFEASIVAVVLLR